MRTLLAIIALGIERMMDHKQESPALAKLGAAVERYEKVRYGSPRQRKEGK